MTSFLAKYSIFAAALLALTVREAGCDALSQVVLSILGTSRGGAEATYRDWQRAMELIDNWLDTWRLPIGLYVRDVDIARVVIEKCANRGWRVPEDVAIVAGWNEEELCNRPDPSITSLEVPYEQVGYEAARMLDRLIDEKKVPFVPDTFVSSFVSSFVPSVVLKAPSFRLSRES